MPRSSASDGERGARSSARSPASDDAPALTRLLVLVGPTGTGKSDLAIDVAHRLSGEVIGCDAVQVYQGLDAATAKPSPSRRREICHHLIDECDPRQDFSLAEFVERAERAIARIEANGHLPIVAGGTGLYLRGLLRGIVTAPPRDETLRARLCVVAERRGPAFLHRWLGRVDPPTADRLAPGDRQRIVRALELALGTSRTWSERLRDEGTWATGTERYRALKIGLSLEREVLYRALDARVAAFFEAGLVDEVRGLLAAGVPPQANALKAIGYREVVLAIRDGHDPALSVGAVQRSTRRYAKRQLTWFRREPGVVWLDAADDRARLVERILALWQADR